MSYFASSEMSESSFSPATFVSFVQALAGGALPFIGRLMRAKMPTSESRIKLMVTMGQDGCEGIVS